MHVEAVGILVGDDREIGVVVDQERRVDQLAVDLAGERGLGEAGADAGGDLRHRDRARRIDGCEPSGSRTEIILLSMSASASLLTENVKNADEKKRGPAALFHCIDEKDIRD